MSSREAAARLWRELGPFAWLALVPAVHGILLALLPGLSQNRGLVTPSGSVDAGFLAFGLLLLAARFTALFVVPFVAVYLIVQRLLELAFHGRKTEGSLHRR